jgi:hypothetical protein
MGATARPKWRRARGSLTLLTTLAVLSSFFVIAGAQVAGAAQCGRGTTACHLVFQFEDPAGSGSYTDGEPHDALTGATITTTEFNIPPGASVRVEAEDAAGHRVTSFSGTITLAVASSSVPSSEIPPGTTVDAFFSGKTATAVNGVATFGSLSSSHSGTFTLRAETSDAASAVSASFDVWDKRCEQGTLCVVSKPRTMTAALNTSAAGTYFLSLNADSIDCGDSFNHAPGTVSVDSTSAETKVLTITIDKSAVKAAPNNGVTFYQVCYQSDTEFTDRNGTRTTLGLLPDCPSMPMPADAPCILSKTKDKAGNVIIMVLLPAGDPKVH